MWTLISLWLLFGISHSFLAATNVRSFFEQLTPNKPHYFRLMYNLIAVFLLFLIICKTIDLNSDLMGNHYFLIKLIGGLLILSSFYVLFGVAKQMDLMSFFGFKSEDRNGELMTDGWYKIVRHPLYFGLLLLFLGILLLYPTLGVLISVAFSKLYIIVGIEFEETKLRRVFGQKYIDFSIGKKKFIPFIY